MNIHKSMPLMACLCVFAPLTMAAQKPAPAIPDITGAWEQTRDATAPASQQAQLKPEYLKQKQALTQAVNDAIARGEPLATSTQRCLGDGMPGMMGGPFPMEILQSKGQVTIIQEAYTQVRRIYLDEPQLAIDDVEPGFFGHSVGHWEGATLYVDTIGIKEEVMYRNTPHSKDMRIKEKIYYAPSGLLRNEVTIEDPVVLEKPYTYIVSYKRKPDYKLLEYVCEDNRYYVDDKGQQKMHLDAPAK